LGSAKLVISIERLRLNKRDEIVIITSAVDGQSEKFYKKLT